MNKDSELSIEETQPAVTDEIPNDLSDLAAAHAKPPVKPEAVAKDFVDGFEQEFADDSGKRRSRKRRKLFCFHCNRPEGHFLSAQYRWYYSFAVGMTFGLVKIIGPYQCQCCGAKRLMFANWLNLRYWFRS